MNYPLTKNQRYYLPREGKQVIFLHYDDIGLAVVVDDDGETYRCHETHLMDLASQTVMTAENIIEREG